MDVRRSPYAFIAVSVIVIFLIPGSEARANLNDDVCPGLCFAGADPDCNTLCRNMGYPGGYCYKGVTCCCNPKSSKALNIPPP
ncbi:hypothetical protein DY000_02025664 [Brassica cretica]|uniref:Knottin scorpion toxin-like domain-containing protein n=1 Tax=Brassica cretica TaxID=69181 RepID=A0ABQ7EI20_BRACR|nr:hypothetical protein DY000_02025664 [Brassica cretica]